MSPIGVAVITVDVFTWERLSAPRLRLPPLDRAITGRVDTTDQVTVTRAITGPVDTTGRDTTDRVTVTWATMHRQHIERWFDRGQRWRSFRVHLHPDADCRQDCLQQGRPRAPSHGALKAGRFHHVTKPDDFDKPAPIASNSSGN